MQAKTRPCLNTTEPNWDQDFELELEGSQTLRVLCYTVNLEGKDELIGRSALEVILTTPLLLLWKYIIMYESKWSSTLVYMHWSGVSKLTICEDEKYWYLDKT